MRSRRDPGVLLPLTPTMFEVLIALADGLFAASPGVDPTPVAKPVVLQGNLEASNAPSLYEMVDLVTISRAYEANQKVITSRDDLMDKTLKTFG